MTRNIVVIIIMMLFLSTVSTIVLAQELEGFVYDSGQRRDPFIPLITHKTRFAAGLEGVQAIDDIILEGIVYDPRGDSIAILNGVIMKKGQKIGIVKVMDIEEKKVKLTINEMEHTINLIKEGDERRER